MVIPALGVTMLFVFLMQLLIRLWMINSPQYVRKCVRFPQNEDLSDYIMSTMNKTKLPFPAGQNPYGHQGNIPQGYRPRPPPPMYQQDPGAKGQYQQAYSTGPRSVAI